MARGGAEFGDGAVLEPPSADCDSGTFFAVLFLPHIRHDSACAGSKRISMKIRAGYEISYDCPQPTPMILTLSVYPSRISDLLTSNRMRLDPPVPANTYHDGFGNFCHVIRAPAGP